LSIRVRGLLLAVNAFALVVPILAIVWLGAFEDQLIRRTEAQLIGQSVVIAEAWREAWLDEVGIPSDGAPRYAPIEVGDDEYFPFEPILSLAQGVLPASLEPAEFASDREGPAWRAGERIQPILLRAAKMNLSGVRVLDTQGCIVASSGSELGACVGDLPEVQNALAGRYGAVLRSRDGEGPRPAIASISRGGRVRVYTAIPVLSDGQVIASVRMSRTALDPRKALWFDRYRLLAATAFVALLILGISLFLSQTIARPLRTITDGARRIARGERRTPFEPPRLAPRELHEMSAALDQMTTQLSDRAEYIADFAANVSHELKTPITAIRGATELLTQQWQEMNDAERDRFLHNIDHDAERMERLVTRLLQLARIQSAPEFADDIELAGFVESLAREYGDAVRVQLEGAPETLRIHPDHLGSALRNLLDNAIRHGAGERVDLEVAQQGDRVSIRVRDRGPGISPNNQARIFDRFFTTERDRGGTGLGLAIAQAVAETRGGSLRCESSDEGTCFELLL
jgi:signal transduction histidine kinase